MCAKAAHRPSGSSLESGRPVPGMRRSPPRLRRTSHMQDGNRSRSDICHRYPRSVNVACGRFSRQPQSNQLQSTLFDVTTFLLSPNEDHQHTSARPALSTSYSRNPPSVIWRLQRQRTAPFILTSSRRPSLPRPTASGLFRLQNTMAWLSSGRTNIEVGI